MEEAAGRFAPLPLEPIFRQQRRVSIWAKWPRGPLRVMSSFADLFLRQVHMALMKRSLECLGQQGDVAHELKLGEMLLFFFKKKE